MAYQMAATAVTLTDLEGHSPFAGLFKCNPSNICAVFTRFQLTVCSHGSSALTELLVHVYIHCACAQRITLRQTVTNHVPIKSANLNDH